MVTDPSELRATKTATFSRRIFIGSTVVLAGMGHRHLPRRAADSPLAHVCGLGGSRERGELREYPADTVAHQYQSIGAPLSRAGQLQDRIDIPGGPCKKLWAAVGLRYYALCHYFPEVPCHSGAEAHQGLTQELGAWSVYRVISSESLLRGLVNLYRHGSVR